MFKNGLISMLVLLLLGTACTQASSGSPVAIKKREPQAKKSPSGIVAMQKVRLGNPFDRVADVYRIRYMSDGLQVVGYLSKPGETAKKKHPLILFNRGGGLERAKINRNILAYFTYYSSKGYVVLGSQYRGNDGGEGQEEYGGRDVHDVLNLLRLADRLPYVDPDKKVMLGYSRGGMMTYLAMKAGADIKAAAVVGGITDLGQFYKGRKGEPEVIMAMQAMVGHPSRDAAAYRKRSVMDWPERVNAPLLIMHGLKDNKVSPEQADRLDEELTRLNKVHKTVLVPKGNHHLDSHAKLRDREILAWFDRYVKE